MCIRDRAQPVEYSQGNSEGYAPAAQFSPAVEPQSYEPVDVDNFPGTRLPSLCDFLQQDELAPCLMTDQEVLETQGRVDDTHLAPSTPECHAELDKTDEEI